MIYDVTITRTGGICVEADTADAAVEMVNNLSVAEIEKNAQLTGWEASDAYSADGGNVCTK